MEWELGARENLSQFKRTQVLKTQGFKKGQINRRSKEMKIGQSS